MRFKIMENKIIEETNNDRCYTVYMHTSPSGKRYAGITSLKPERRWAKGLGYLKCPYMSKAIKKYGFENFLHEILYVNLTKEEAEQKEVELIAYYDTTNPNKGYNVEFGGNSTGKLSEEQRDKLRNCNLGKKHSEETKRKMSESGKRKIFTEEHKKHLSESKMNKFHSDETIEMMRETSKKNVSVLQFDKNMNFICKYISISEASRRTSIARPNISACCRGIVEHVGGYIWKYASDMPTYPLRNIL